MSLQAQAYRHRTRISMDNFREMMTGTSIYLCFYLTQTKANALLDKIKYIFCISS